MQFPAAWDRFGQCATVAGRAGFAVDRELSGFRPLMGGGLEGRGVSRMDQSHGLGGGGNGPH